ncbi:MAG: hypothetical protein L3J83_07270 [Proteobacteria bacterium]|nr:hypothetical protein [Pseudomonadota bacterium]
MSIELPKYTLQTNENKPKKLVKILLPLSLFLGLITGYFASGLYANQTIKTLKERNGVLEETNSRNQDLISQQNSELSILRTEQKVKQHGVLLLQADYKASIDAQESLKAEIKFYERLLSPDANNKGLRVFETSLQETSNLSYALKIILVQKIERARNIAGRYNIQLIGNQNGQVKTVQLSNNNDSKFDFKYFYTVSLSFSMPEGFKPEQLVVELLPENKKAKTVRHTVDWQQLINAGKDHVQ